MAFSQFNRFRLLLLLVAIGAAQVWANKTGNVDADGESPLSALSLGELDEKLQVRRLWLCWIMETADTFVDEQQCAIVQELNQAKAAEHAHTTSSFVSRLFAILFPGTPAVNALLATLYISGPPNFLLALCPTNIDPSSLSVMVAFAVGGLLGDTLFHLLPEIFVGEDALDSVRFVLVEPNRNLLLGAAIMVGFLTFVAMDKGLRIATGGGGHDHSRGHGHSHAGSSESDAAKSTSVELQGSKGVKSRSKKDKKGAAGPLDSAPAKEANASMKLGGLLNLM
jgi:solute carrier family 39 (zinc transporter), member 7